MKKIFYFMYILFIGTKVFCAIPDSWVHINPGAFQTVTSIQGFENLLYLNSDSGLFRSTDNGTTWQPLQVDSTDKKIKSFTIDSSGNILAGTVDSMLYWSVDQGNNWSYTAKTNFPIVKLIIHPPYIYAADGQGNLQCRIYRSSDSGAHFTTVYIPELFITLLGWAVAPNGTLLNTTTGRYSNNGVLSSSSDSGNTWNDLWSIQPNTISAFICTNKGDLLIGTTSSFAMGILGLIFRSTDNGITWSPLTAPWQLADVTSLTVNSEGAIFAGIYHQGVFCSKDTGATWTQMIDGLPTNVAAFSITAHNDYVFIYDIYNTQGFYRNTTPVAGVFEHEMPNGFSLMQNYPNPFNPVTRIVFNLEHRSNVNLSVFDINGRLISTLVDEVIQMGNHEMVFDAKNLSSGTYYYRLTTNEGIQTRKMVFQK